MTTRPQKVILLSLFFAMGIATTAFPKERRVRLSELLDKSDRIAVVQLLSDGVPGQRVEVMVKAVARGDIVGGQSIFLVYPQMMEEAVLPYASPTKDSLRLVFLKSGDSEGTYEVVFGYQGLRAVSSGDENIVAESLMQFARWEKLTPEERAELMAVSLSSTCSTMRRIALDWIIVDEKLLADDRSKINASDKVVSALIHIRGEEDASMRCNAILVLAMTMRKDLIEYLVEALDDPQTRYLAISRLQGHLWKRGDPWPPPSYNPASDPKLVDQAVAGLKKWWAEVGSKDPAYKKFAPPSTKNGTEKYHLSYWRR